MDFKTVKLQLLDTAGQERFKTITSLQYRSAMGIILVYDVTSEQSFRHIEDWLKNVEKQASPFANKILIGWRLQRPMNPPLPPPPSSADLCHVCIQFMYTSILHARAIDEI